MDPIVVTYQSSGSTIASNQAVPLVYRTTGPIAFDNGQYQYDFDDIGQIPYFTITSGALPNTSVSLDVTGTLADSTNGTENISVASGSTVNRYLNNTYLDIDTVVPNSINQNETVTIAIDNTLSNRQTVTVPGTLLRFLNGRTDYHFPSGYEHTITLNGSVQRETDPTISYTVTGYNAANTFRTETLTYAVPNPSGQYNLTTTYSYNVISSIVPVNVNNGQDIDYIRWNGSQNIMTNRAVPYTTTAQPIYFVGNTTSYTFEPGIAHQITFLGTVAAAPNANITFQIDGFALNGAPLSQLLTVSAAASPYSVTTAGTYHSITSVFCVAINNNQTVALSISAGSLDQFTPWIQMDTYNGNAQYSVSYTDVTTGLGITPQYTFQKINTFVNGEYVQNDPEGFDLPIDQAGVIVSPDGVTLPIDADAAISVRGLAISAFRNKVTSATGGAFTMTLLQQGARY